MSNNARSENLQSSLGLRMGGATDFLTGDIPDAPHVVDAANHQNSAPSRRRAEHSPACSDSRRDAGMRQHAVDGGSPARRPRWRQRAGELGRGLLRSVAVALLMFGLDQAVAEDLKMSRGLAVPVRYVFARTVRQGTTAPELMHS